MAMDDVELTRLAEEELMREAKRGEARAAVHGVMGWLNDKTPRTNKRFLSTTISNALQHNHRQCNVGTHREEISVHQSKKKLKRTEHTHPYPSITKTNDETIKQRHKHKSSKSKCKDGEDVLSDKQKQVNRYHSPKRKQ